MAKLRAKHRVDPMGSFDGFQNFWMSKVKDATKLDWDRTFANWVAEDFGRGRLKPLDALDDLPILRLPNREELLRRDLSDANEMTGFSFGATK